MPYIGDPIKINQQKVKEMTEYSEKLESMSHSELVEEVRKLESNITFVDGVWSQRLALEKEMSEAIMADYKEVLAMFHNADRIIRFVYESMYTHKVMLPDDVVQMITDYTSEPF
jgi:hypothetical protein